jgi:hypothetical protein
MEAEAIDGDYYLYGYTIQVLLAGMVPELILGVGVLHSMQ